MANLGIRTYSGLSSYILFRHSGGSSPDHVLALAATYAAFNAGNGAGNPLLFKDDRAAAETPSRVYPKDNGFRCAAFQVINDSAVSIFFSFDGVKDHFELFAGENVLFDKLHTDRIWLRGAAGGEAYRLIVW